jgi:DNA-binding transcriptional LysR family regulator
MKLNNINLDKLKVVTALNKTRSFSKAAELLNLTPSAVNQSLTSLEDQMGVKLFIRRGKVILPTDACRKIDKLFVPFSSDLENLLDSESTSQKEVSGRLKVFVPTLVGPILLSKPFLNFLEHHPKVSLAIDNGPAPKAISEIQNNNFDLGICGLKKLINQNKWCYSKHLTHLTMGLYCSPKYYDQYVRQIKAKDFDNLLFMTGVSTQFMLDWYFKDILKRKFRSPSRFSMYDMSFTVQAVAKGFGIGLLAKELVQTEIDKKQIIDIGTAPLIHPLYLIHQKDKKLNALEKCFIEDLQDYFKSK